ncbi:peptidyl-prolyl cis-trans isomerase PASTICCINO1-like isoform X2 [Bradysia coprophila]|uniref:peptidyl-prolyl cis-trans isomerase PASTICCINO1-like isoform X2 n=1 Tax=Bradysia coprophila TaxID=38358 RepID=UPI00187DA786|nr:peptidyl-prolyl cis-trans isomerase PASTICCINO1-like isoform X2 [Bradysia coprophila]
MANESEHVQKLSDFQHLVATEWSDESRGLRKVLMEFNYTKMDRVADLSECLVEISDVANLSGRESEYLSDTKEKLIRMGDAVTPIDYFVEIFIRQMYVGEVSRCYVTTKTDHQIEFTIKLMAIDCPRYFYELSPKELFEISSKYKEQGVKMYKKYPEFAQNYFNLAAKLLISLKPFNTLDDREANESFKHQIDQQSLQALHDGIYLNIAAGLIKQNRYEDALYVLIDLTDRTNNEKGIYRRALAHLNLKQYDEARQQIERLNFKENHEFHALHNRIASEMKEYNERYANMVKKMFG